MELPLYDCPFPPLARKLVLDLVADLEAQVLELLPGSLLRVDARGKARLESIVVQVLADEDQLAHPRLVLPPFRVELAGEDHVHALVHEFHLRAGHGEHTLHSEDVGPLRCQQVLHPPSVDRQGTG